MMKYDQLIEAVGSRGKYQKRLYILIFIAIVPSGLTTLLTVFTHYSPPHHCMFWPENVSLSEHELLAMKELLIPKKDGVYESCTMYNASFHEVLNLLHSEDINNANLTSYGSPINCPNGYYYERDYSSVETAVTEFNMVCDRAWIKPLMTSLYMGGQLIGSLSGKLSDRFGRKWLFLIFTYANFVAIALDGVAWSVTSYAIFMLISGMCQLVNFVVGFVLSCEFMNAEDRNTMSLGPFLAFSTGYVLSALFGYLLLNWRRLLIVNGLIGILFIPYYRVIPESPRWLLMKGRIDEARVILEQVAKMNGKTVDVRQLMEDGVDLDKKESKKITDESLLVFLRNRVMCVRFFVCCFSWFATSLVYYTIGLNTSGLAGNRFVNCLLAAAVEFPAYTVGFFCIKYAGRPMSQTLLLVIAGILCTSAPFLRLVNPTLTVVVAMTGKFVSTSVFFIVYIYFAELVPTLKRNLCVGLGSFSARIASLIAPYLIFAGESIHESIPYTMMGSMAVLCACLTVFFLPETRHVPLPEITEDALANRK